MTRSVASLTPLCWALCALTLGTSAACGGGGSGDRAGAGGAGGAVPGGRAGGGAAGHAGAAAIMHPDKLPSAAHTLAGVVTDVAMGSRIAGATVSVVGKDQTTSTNTKGEFAFADLAEGRVSLSIVKDGYAPGYATADSGDQAQAALVSLKKLGSSQSYDPSQAATLFEKTDNGPYAVIFTPDSLDTTDTRLHVTVTPLDPTREDAALPGDLIAGGASPNALNAVTFAEFGIVDSAGKRVNLKASASAIVELPIPIALRVDHPLDSKIHCYAYDPSTGRWEDFVEGTVALSSVDMMTPVLRASIRHFSWYGGAPAIQDQACVLVQVFSKVTGKPLAGAAISARPGLTAQSNQDGIALVTVEKGAKVKYTASKTYTDTYVDDAGNLISQAGSKVIEFGRVEEDEELVPLTTGPCTGTESTANPSKGVRVDTAPLPNGAYVYDITAVIQGTQTSVIIERGVPDTDGSPLDAEPVDGARVTLRSEGGQTIDLMSLSASFPAGTGVPATGLYVSPMGMTVPASGGERYTLSVDVDGNGSVDATGACSVPGTLAWVVPDDGGEYAADGFTASWTDSASGRAGYSTQYVAYFAAESGNSIGAVYTGSERSFRPDPALAPGTYSATLQTAYSMATFTGVSVQGNLLCGASTTSDVTFTIK
jgi:hypothetical protein